MHEILRKILTIGNFMNAGDPKRGQADGFILGDAFNKVVSLRSVDNESILKIICKKMYEDDENFVTDFKTPFKDCYDAKKCIIQDIEKGLKKCKGDATVQKGQFETTIKQVPDLENQTFGKDIKKFLDGTDATISNLESQFEKMKSTLKEVCDLYMFSKNDEVREKSEKFLEFWCNFVDTVQNSMPKVEKKKTAKAKDAKSAKKKAPSLMDNDMMAELRAKQAAMKKK